MDNVLVFFFSEKMVQSAAIKQGQLTNRKHTYFFFFFALADPTIYHPKSKFLIYSTQAAAVLRYHLFLTMTAGCVRQLICSAHDRISEKVNLKVCCFESSKQKRIDHWCSVVPEKAQPSGPPFSGKLGKPRFPLERWALGLGFFCFH